MTVPMTVADFDSEDALITYAQTQPSAWMGCVCGGDPDCYCGGAGVYPAWLHDPETVVRSDGS